MSQQWISGFGILGRGLLCWSFVWECLGSVGLLGVDNKVRLGHPKHGVLVIHYLERGPNYAHSFKIVCDSKKCTAHGP